MAFGTAWKPPCRETISIAHLKSSYDDISKRIDDILQESQAICISIDGFSDVNSRSLFNVMAGYSIPFVMQTFRLEDENKSSENADKLVSRAIIKSNINERRKVFGIFTDSPNVMRKARKLLSGAIPNGSNSVAFAYGCCCH